MRVVLSTFACSGIEARLGGDLAAGVKTALRHYARSGGSSAQNVPRFPHFLGEPQVGHPGADLDLTVDPEIQALLEREARETDGVSVEQIATHAVLAYLADLDRASGRDASPLTLV